LSKEKKTKIQKADKEYQASKEKLAAAKKKIKEKLEK